MLAHPGLYKTFFNTLANGFVAEATGRLNKHIPPEKTQVVKRDYGDVSTSSAVYSRSMQKGKQNEYHSPTIGNAKPCTHRIVPSLLANLIHVDED